MNTPQEKASARAVNVRMPIDIIAQLDKAKAETGLPYSAVIVAALRKQFGLPAPTEHLFEKEEP